MADKGEEKELLIYTYYSETGHQGRYEHHEDWTLSLSEPSRSAVVTLTMSETRRSFPEKGDTSVSRYELTVDELVRLIELNGRPMPNG